MASRGKGRGLRDHTSLARSGASTRHATTRPGARRSGRTCKSGKPAGGPGAFKRQPALGRRQGEPSTRSLDEGRKGAAGPGRPRQVTRTLIGPVRGHRAQAGRGAGRPLTNPLGPGPGSGPGLYPGSSVYSSCGGTPARPHSTGYAAEGSATNPKRPSLTPVRTGIGTGADQPGVSQSPGGCPDPKPKWRRRAENNSD